ncbi:alpha/beta-hydrolase [Cadophora sp. DSE1049]|nr:alpha/beta-hydrolase [Cadophora sp. DSE1049]
MIGSSTKPTIVILHGAWHSAVHFGPLISLLTKAGYPAICPTQPTYNAQPPTKDLYDDANLVQSILKQLIEEEEKNVIVVMHSYGGVVGTQAGLKGGVKHLLYMTAFVVKLGDTLAQTFGGSLPPFIPIEDGSCNMMDPKLRFYNDLPPEDQDRWVAELRPYPAAASYTTLTNAGYEYVPCTYLFCKNDQGLLIEYQRAMVEDVGVKMKEISCGSGHSPFLSMPEKVVETINGIMKFTSA